MIIIEFTEEEFTELKKKSEQRVENNKQRNSQDKKINAQRTGAQIDFDGVKAEGAFLKMLNLPFRYISVNQPTLGWQFQMNGNRIKVYFSTHKGGNLIVNSVNDFRSDMTVYTEYNEERSVRIVGWITREEFIKSHQKRNFGYGLHCYMPPHELQDIEKLKSRLTLGGTPWVA